MSGEDEDVLQRVDGVHSEPRTALHGGLLNRDHDPFTAPSAPHDHLPARTPALALSIVYVVRDNSTTGRIYKPR